MKIAIALLVVIIPIALLIWAFCSWLWRKTEHKAILPGKTANEMARLLQRGVDEPLFATTTEYRETAEALLSRHYESGGK